MRVTSFRPKAGSGRRVGTFCIDIPAMSLNRLTLIRKQDGKLDVRGGELNHFIQQVALAVLAHAEVQQHEQ